MKLNERVIIVNVNISEWNGRRFDREVTEEVNSIHNTRKAGVYTKYLIDIEHLKAIVTQRGKIRAFHVKNTLPWGDGGDRLLPSARYIEYMKGIQPLVDEFDDLVKEFLANWPSIKAEGARNLKGLYKESDYPTLDELRSRFGVKVGKSMLPDTNDFRLDLSDETVSAIREQIEHDLNDRHVNAVEDILSRIKAAVKRVVVTLSKEDAKFKNSMIGNIETLLEVIPSLNYTADPKIDRVLKELETLVVDPDDIRADDNIKEDILERAKKLEETYF